MLTKPNFLIIGAPQCATTSLWDIFCQHPDIYMSKIKEPAFFSNDEVFSLGLEWYQSIFEDVKGKLAIGEATSHYCNIESYPKTPERIAKYVPNVKLIFSVRHPLERMESAWLQCLSTSHPMPREFNKAVREYRTIVENSHYWTNLNAYRRYFSDEQILLIFFEDFKENPQKVLETCYRFLRVNVNVNSQDVERPRNTKVGKYMKRRSYVLFNKLPVSDYIKKLIPRQMKTSLKNLGMVPLPPRPTWDEQTRNWALEQVREEAKAILNYGRKPMGYWDLI